MNKDIEQLVEELDGYVQLFEPAFRRREQWAWSRVYLRGLLGKTFRKTIERIALELGENVRDMSLIVSPGSLGLASQLLPMLRCNIRYDKLSRRVILLSGINPFMTSAWYALNTKPRKEDFLWEQCLAHGYETFYPRLRVQPVNPRARKIRPYFPGYLFVYVDLEKISLSTLRWMPGAARVVAFDGVPATVPEGLIRAIQQRVEEVNAAGGELFDGLRSGDVVYIQDGPFAGYEAIFDARLPGSERVRVLLKLLQKRQVPVDLPAGQIQRKNRR